MTDISGLFDSIGYAPKDRTVFETALTHSSCVGETNNERLEFLGDAVLELICSEMLFSSFPDMDEGMLSKLRSELVCEAALNEWAKSVELGSYIRIGKGEERSGGREKPSILSDAVEALIAAVYIDGGYASAKEFAEKILGFLMKLKKSGLLMRDAKTALQELLQGEGELLPVYEVVRAEGPPHAMIFTVTVTCGGKLMGTGVGSSKKQAEQEAAKSAVAALKKNK